MNENSDAATAQWLTQSYNFTYLTYAALNSFATAQKDFLRQILAAELALTIALDNDGDNALAYNTMRSGLVFAPDTCSDTDLAAIPWLQVSHIYSLPSRLTHSKKKGRLRARVVAHQFYTLRPRLRCDGLLGRFQHVLQQYTATGLFRCGGTQPRLSLQRPACLL